MTLMGAVDITPILMDGHDVSSRIIEWGDNIEAFMEDTAPLGPTGGMPRPEYVNQKLYTLSLTGFYDDDAVTGLDALLVAGGATQHILCYCYEGGTFGKKFTGASEAIQKNYQRLAATKQFQKLKTSIASAGHVEEGAILRAVVSINGDSDGVDLDNTASTPDGGAGYVQVTELTLAGWTDLTPKIQHSALGVVWVDLIVFTDVAAVGAERIQVAGVVERHLRDNWTWNGAGAAKTATVFSGFARY